MTGRLQTGRVPRIALTREEAAAALGMSLDSFERYVQPHLCIIRLGKLRLVAVGELEDWARRAGDQPAQRSTREGVRFVEQRKRPGDVGAPRARPTREGELT